MNELKVRGDGIYGGDRFIIALILHEVIKHDLLPQKEVSLKRKIVINKGRLEEAAGINKYIHFIVDVDKAKLL